MKKAMPRVYFGFDAESRPGEHIFLSYSRGDAGRIKKIALELHQMGLPIWYDEALKPGEEWNLMILREVKQSRIAIFFLTNELFNRDRTFMINERKYAKDHNIRRIYIWLDDIAKINSASLSEKMYLWWADLVEIQGIEVFHLKTDAEKAEEIYHGLCRADRKFTQYASKTESTSKSQPTPQMQSVKPTPPAPRLNVQVGGKVPFGQYPQGANGEVQPLVWRVLAVENGRALLITDKLIDYVKYNESLTNVTWETCTLRKWMNNDFISKAFSSDQQAQIATVTNQNSNNPEYGTKGGKPTQDKIFALSIEEANRYFSSNSDRKAYTTDYAHKRGSDSDDRSDWWWLRSPGYNCYYAACVNYVGDIHQLGYDVSRSRGAVRPAFWLNL